MPGDGQGTRGGRGTGADEGPARVALRAESRVTEEGRPGVGAVRMWATDGHEKTNTAGFGREALRAVRSRRQRRRGRQAGAGGRRLPGQGSVLRVGRGLSTEGGDGRLTPRMSRCPWNRTLQHGQDGKFSVRFTTIKKWKKRLDC